MKRLTPWLVAVAAALCAAAFLYATLPSVPWGPVTGTGQDEWYNVIRSLRALYEWLHPSYFIHPALYYELLALCFGIQRLWLGVAGSLADGMTFLDHYLAHQEQYSDLARCVSLACGMLTVAAAVWLGALLSTVSGGLLVGLVVASLPLMRALSTCIRVDALALGTYVLAAGFVVRWAQRPSQRALLVACVAIGVAASANYPGAMLLVLLAWLEWNRPGDDDRAQRARRCMIACAVAFGAFLLLNPYVLLDVRVFLKWFLFQAEVPLYKHPFAPEPSPWLYLVVLRDQGPAAVAACVAGVLAMLQPRRPAGAIAVYAVVHIVGFSLMQTQYDRFVLPSITLLCIAGAAWLCERIAAYGGSVVATLLALIASAAVVWSATTRLAAERPRDHEVDYRAEMFEWLALNVPPSSTLVLESDTMPLMQTVYDPVDRGLHFQAQLRAAFEKRHPTMVKDVVKAQYIAAVYNYDPVLLNAANVYFLASSQNREFIAINRDLLPEPMRFYEALDRRAAIVHQTAGFREKLQLYAVKP